jgi:hypothetical protein
LNNLQRALHAIVCVQVIHGVGSDPSTMNGGHKPATMGGVALVCE